MEESPPIVTILIAVITAVVSIRAFSDSRLMDRYIFSPHAILARGEYYRLVTSALLHLDGSHLFFNLLSFYLFGRNLEPEIGPWHFLAIYLSAIVGGNLLSLYLHRHHEYLALGASGGVCGIIFASIFVFPDSQISMLFLPIGIPAWLYAILFLFTEFQGFRSGRAKVGHDAHLGGAIIGLLAATAFYPRIVLESPRMYAAVMVVSLLMLFYFWNNPLNLPLRSFFASGAKSIIRPPKPQATPEEIDAVLEKISEHGLHSLTEKERRILREASGK